MASERAEVFRRLARAVFDAQTALLKHGDVANAPFGQSSARWRVLLHISLGEPTVADIARSTGYSRQAVQRLADALVAAGSAAYVVDEADRRKQRIELTRQGKETLGQLEAHFDIWADRLLTQLPEAELIEVTAALEHFKAIVLADMQSMKRQGT